MARYEIVVDEENNAEEFWEAFRENMVGTYEAPMKFLLTWDKVVCEDEDERDQLLSKLRTLPGWNSGPAHAPHPVVVREI